MSLWLLTRLVAAVAFAYAEMPPLLVGAAATTSVLLVLCAVILADLARRRERAWFDDLGVGRRGALFLQLVWGCLAEVLFTVASVAR